jgi:hypothetical protein
LSAYAGEIVMVCECGERYFNAQLDYHESEFVGLEHVKVKGEVMDKTLNEIRNSATCSSEHIDLLEMEIEQLQAELVIVKQSEVEWSEIARSVVNNTNKNMRGVIEQLQADVERWKGHHKASMEHTAQRVAEVNILDKEVEELTMVVTDYKMKWLEAVEEAICQAEVKKRLLSILSSSSDS